MTTELVRSLLWLCEIPSTTGNEGPIADALEARLLRATHNNCCVRRVGHSLVVNLNSDHSGPRVGLVGHTDVVPTSHDGPPRIEGDRLYGPGASDMKSGLALMLGLLESPAATGVPLTLVFYAAEEGPYALNELGAVFEQVPELRDLDVALALEPTDNQLQLGCGGSIQAKVEFRGKSAHSSRPWQGENAIYKSVDLLAQLRRLEPKPRLVDGLTWMTSISATLAQAGRAPNVVPDEFTLNLNARYAPDQTTEEVEAQLRELVGADATITLVDVSPPAPPHRSHPLLCALETAGATEVHPKYAWTDVARFAACGVPAANFGPGTLSQAHQRNEWTSIEKLLQADQILRRWLELIARPAPSAAHSVSV